MSNQPQHASTNKKAPARTTFPTEHSGVSSYAGLSRFTGQSLNTGQCCSQSQTMHRGEPKDACKHGCFLWLRDRTSWKAIEYYQTVKVCIASYHLFLGHPTSLAACPVVASPLDPSLPDNSRGGISDNRKHLATPATLIHGDSKVVKLSQTVLEVAKWQLAAQPDSQLNANPSLPSSLSCLFQPDLCATPDSSNVPLCSITLVLS